MTNAVLPGGVPKAAWRLVKKQWADLSGEGARLKGGRWNSPGNAVVYLSEDAALPVLESLVHLDLPRDLIPHDYVLMRIDLTVLESDEAESWLEEGPEDLTDPSESRAYGDLWIREERSLILRVPSAIVPESLNLILNSGHVLVSDLPDPTSRPFEFDSRLL